MNKTVKARPDHKFVLTELGFEESRIRAKYKENSAMRKQYESCVPVGWIEKGWVKEVKIDG